MHFVESRRYRRNKMYLLGESATLRMAQWHQRRPLPGFANISVVHFLAWACSESQYGGASRLGDFLHSHCFSPPLLWLSQPLRVYCCRDLRFALGILLFYFCPIHSSKKHCARPQEYISSSRDSFDSQDCIPLLTPRIWLCKQRPHSSGLLDLGRRWAERKAIQGSGPAAGRRAGLRVAECALLQSVSLHVEIWKLNTKQPGIYFLFLVMFVETQFAYNICFNCTVL